MQMYGLKRNLRRKGVARVSRRHWRIFSKELLHHPILCCLQILLHEILIISCCAPPLICRSTRISR
jgi:hypothetical protein